MRSRIDVVQVELGSAMYKEGFRWTEFMESDSFGKQDTKYMVLNNILINHFCKICSVQCSTSRLALGSEIPNICYIFEQLVVQGCQ